MFLLQNYKISHYNYLFYLTLPCSAVSTFLGALCNVFFGGPYFGTIHHRLKLPADRLIALKTSDSRRLIG